MVPKGWQVEALGEIATFRNGLNFLKDSGGQEVRVVGIPHFWQRQIMESFDEIRPIPIGSLGKDDHLQSGDLLFVRSNGNKELIGRCMFFPKVEEAVSFSGFTIRGRVNPARILPEFAAAMMQTRQVKDQIARGGGGTNISNLSQAILSAITIPVPPLPEQKKIAEVLSTWDAAINTAEKLFVNSETQKRALMQQLLTGQRRSGSWISATLGDVLARIVGGGTPDRSNPAYWTGDIPWVTVKDLKGNVILDTVDKITNAGVRASAATMIPSGSIVIATRMAVGRCVVLARDMAINQDLKALFPAPVMKNRYLYWLMKQLEGALASMGTGSTVKGIVLSDIRRNPIKYPKDLREQENIADILDASQAEMEMLARQVNVLRSEKTGLMQQILMGKRRVTL